MAIQIRRGTDLEWESNNSNIVAGEPAVTTDTGRFFVGTGNGEFVELQKKGKWYYLDLKDGYMYTGTHTIDGKTYTFADNGEMI